MADKLGKTSIDKEDEQSRLGGVVSSVAQTLGNTFSSPQKMADFAFSAPIPGISVALGALAHGIMGTEPADKGAARATFGLSNLAGLFDAIERMGVSVARPGSGPLAGPRPDISDPAVQGALADRATDARQRAEAAEVDRADRARRGPVEGIPGVTDIQGIGFSPARGESDPDATDNGAAAAAAAAAEGVSGVGGQGSVSGGLSGGNEGQGGGGGAGDGGSRSDGADRGEGQGGSSFHKGGAFLITEQMLTGKDPRGPDTGQVSFKARPGEMVLVFPPEMVKRYGPEKMKMFFESWRAHFKEVGKSENKMPMPKMKRKAAM